MNILVLLLPTALFLAGCGSAPQPAPAPAPEPIAEAEPEEPGPEEPDQVVLSSALIEARMREPFGVQSSGRPPARVPRDAVIVPMRAPLPTSGTDQPDDPDDGQDAEDAFDADDEAGSAGVADDTEPPNPSGRVRPIGPAGPAAAANTTDPTPTRPTSAPPTSTIAGSGQRTHTVQPGETFYAIARRYSVSPMALAAANPGVDIQRIRPGQTLRLPQEEPVPAARAQRSHRVQAGETLWSISRRYGVSPAQIRQANRMTDDTVRIGETLIIPSS